MENIYMSEYLTILTGECTDELIDPAIKFPYKLDHFQMYSCISISKDENVLVTAHTGSGKTAIAEYAIAHYVKKRKRVVYTSPIKTLSNQKYGEFRNKFETEDISVGLMTGDNKINPNADIVIMTTEILRNTLYDMEKDKDIYFEDNFIDKVGCVIFDEVHYINDKDRGHVWEETINLLNPNVTLVMLSATIDKPEQFASWIGDIKKKRINLIPTDHRVVPLEHFIFVNENIHKLLDKDNKFYDNIFDEAVKLYKEEINNRKSQKFHLNNMIKYLKKNNMFQTIFFSFSRKNCEKFANSVSVDLITYEERTEALKIFNKYMVKYRDQYEHTAQYEQVKRLIEKGLCYHHSGLLPVLKEIIEIIFQKGLLKILFATETFAVGVNMPTRSIVYTALDKYTKDGHRPLHTAEYKQMSGRAGRRGIDKYGYVIILPLYDFPDKQDLKQMMLGRVPAINSKFTINYSFILKIIQSNNKNFTEFINSSMYDRFNSIQISLQRDSLTKPTEPDISDNLSDCINLIKEEKRLNNMGFQLNKKQIKQKRRLLNKIKYDPILKKEYDSYNTYLNELYDYEYNSNQLEYMENYVSYEADKIIKLLYDYCYISAILPYDRLTDKDVTMKGVLASQINECNPLLLTEIIVRDMFNDMSIEEIIGFVGIFIDDIKDKCSYNDICKLDLPNILLSKIDIIHTIINDYNDSEKRLDIQSDDDFWSISYDYVQLGYLWANKCTLQDIFNNVDIYEGNFVKSMLKINNIIQDLIILHHIYDNLAVIPKLESAQELILRDIVTVNSLYIYQ